MVDTRETVIGEIVTEDYLFTLTELRGVLFCHIEVYNWSIPVYKKMLCDFAEIRQNIPSEFYGNIPKTNLKAIKLAKLFGFVPEYETYSTIILRSGWGLEV